MKILLTISLTLIYSLSFGQVKKLYRKAEKTKDLSDKITLFSQIINLQPKDLDAYFYRAIAKHDLGDYNGAILDYSKVIIEKPDADTYLNRGNSRYSLGDFEGAKLDYNKAYELDKNLIGVRYSLGCVKYDLGDFKGAFLDFNSIIQNYAYKRDFQYSKEDVYKSLIMRALTHEALGSYTDAIEDYSSIILINPNSENYYNRGKLLTNLKYYQEAITDLKKSSSLDRNNEYVFFYKGVSNLFLGKFMNAISDFSEAIKFDPTDFDAYLGLAITYFKINDTANAKLNFEKANSILSIGEKITTIEQYKNTYWFHNQYYYLNNNIIKLVNLK